MPTKRPRVTTTLPPQVYETISRMALLTGRSRGAIVADLLDSVHIPLTRTVALMEAAKDAPEDVKRNLRGTVEALERQAYASAEALTGQMDLVTEITRIAREASQHKEAGGRVDPRTSNTGVRSAKRAGSGK